MEQDKVIGVAAEFHKNARGHLELFSVWVQRIALSAVTGFLKHRTNCATTYGGAVQNSAIRLQTSGVDAKTEMSVMDALRDLIGRDGQAPVAQITSHCRLTGVQ